MGVAKRFTATNVDTLARASSLYILESNAILSLNCATSKRTRHGLLRRVLQYPGATGVPPVLNCQSIFHFIRFRSIASASPDIRLLVVAAEIRPLRTRSRERVGEKRRRRQRDGKPIGRVALAECQWQYACGRIWSERCESSSVMHTPTCN